MPASVNASSCLNLSYHMQGIAGSSDQGFLFCNVPATIRPETVSSQYSSPRGCWCYQSLRFTGGETEAQEEAMAPSQGHSYKVIVKSGFELRTFDPKIFVHNLSTVYTKLLKFCDLKSYISFCCYPFSFLKN